jgi:hypothetical protein
VKAGCVKLKEGSGRINFSVLVSDEKTDLLQRGKRWPLKAFGIMWRVDSHQCGRLQSGVCERTFSVIGDWIGLKNCLKRVYQVRNFNVVSIL